MDIKALEIKSILVIIFAVAGCLSAFSVAQSQTPVEITFGSERVFNTASTSNNTIAVLSSDKFVTVYQDGGGNFNKGVVVVGEVSNDNINFGSEYVFNDTATDYIAAVSLSESEFIVAYQDTGNSNYGAVIVGNVFGSAISFGSEYVFNTANTEYISIAVLSQNKFVVAYQDAGNPDQGAVMIGEIFGNKIVFGPKCVFNTAATNYISAVPLSESKLAIAYQDGGNYDYGMAVIGDVSGRNVTFGSEYIFNNVETDYISIDTFSDNKFVVAYRDVSAYLNYGAAIIGEVSGKGISFGSEYVFNAGATSYISSSLLSQNKLAVAYKDESNLDYGAVIIGDVSDKIISFGSEYVFNQTATNANFISALTENNFIAAYQSHNGGTNYGIAVIGNIPADEITITEKETVEEKTTAETTTETETMIADGDLIRNPSAEGMAQFDIYIAKTVGSKKFKRLILSPHVFESYAHFDKNGNKSPWDDVQDVNQTTMDAYVVSDLVRADGDTKVYQLTANGDSGTKRLLSATDEDFPAYYDLNSVYIINATDRDAYVNAS